MPPGKNRQMSAGESSARVRNSSALSARAAWAWWRSVTSVAMQTRPVISPLASRRGSLWVVKRRSPVGVWIVSRMFILAWPLSKTSRSSWRTFSARSLG